MNSSSLSKALVRALFVALLAMLPARSAGAQQAEPNPSLQEKETARKLLDLGRAAEAKGDLAGAIVSYRAAHAIMGVPTTAIYLANALAKSGKLIEARDVALQSSRAPKLKNERPERTRARDDSAKLVEDLGPRIPSIIVAVQPADLPGLAITIDGQQLPPSVHQLPWAVDPGEHTVKAAAPGQPEQSKSVRTLEGAKETVTFAFFAPAAAPILPPPPRKRPKRARGMGPLTIGGIVAISAGGASLIAGAVTGGVSLAQTNDIKAQCDGARCPSSLQEDADGAQTLATASNVTLGVGGALAVAGAVALGIGLHRDGASSRVGLFVKPGGAWLGGEF